MLASFSGLLDTFSSEIVQFSEKIYFLMFSAGYVIGVCI